MGTDIQTHVVRAVHIDVRTRGRYHCAGPRSSDLHLRIIQSVASISISVLFSVRAHEERGSLF